MALANTPNPAPTLRGACSVGRLLKTMRATERRALQQMLDGDWQSKRIWLALTSEGYEGVNSGDTVSRHRRGDCSCKAVR